MERVQPDLQRRQLALRVVQRARPSDFSISRRMASDRDGASFWRCAHASIRAANSGANRMLVTGVFPVGAGPGFLRNTGIDCFIEIV
jgi:hypothetical protein